MISGNLFDALPAVRAATVGRGSKTDGNNPLNNFFSLLLTPPPSIHCAAQFPTIPTPPPAAYRVSLCLCILCWRRPLGNANPSFLELSEGAIDGACRERGRGQAGSEAWRAGDRPNERKVRAKRGSTLTNQIWPTSKKGRKERRTEGADWNCKIAAAARESPSRTLCPPLSALEEKRYSA